jgi:hypothetical protein
MGAAIGIGALAIAIASAPRVFAGAKHSHSGGGDDDGSGIQHVLLISVDGLHALDYLNCSNGIAGVNGGAPYCPNLAALAKNGVNYLDTSTSKPSDSFPGLMALMTGGSPRTMGVNYDVAYDRVLNPPSQTTGNGLPAGPCTSGATPSGTGTEYDEGINLNNVPVEAGQNLLNGGAPSGDGEHRRSDPAGPRPELQPVYPWNYSRYDLRGDHAGVIRRGPTSSFYSSAGSHRYLTAAM